VTGAEVFFLILFAMYLLFAAWLIHSED